MFTGKLVRWNDGKGFGFIHLKAENRDVFIHISALSHMSRRPLNGDVIVFDIVADTKGKPKAVNAKIEGIPQIEPTSKFWSLAAVRNESKNNNIKQQTATEFQSKPLIKKQSSPQKWGYNRKSDNLLFFLAILFVFIFLLSSVIYLFIY